MAGDWIKIEHALPDKPEVMEIAHALKIDADAVVGKLIRVWTWFDVHTENGNANVTMRALLDRYTGVTGFIAEMQNVGWIAESNGVLTINKFERHNGQTAKNRANTNRRVAKLRKCNDDGVTNVTLEPLQKALPEKRREEKRIKDTTHTISNVSDSVCVIESPFVDLPKETKITMDELMARINALKPSWCKLARWTRNEMEALRGGVASQMETLTDEDWQLLKDFLNSTQQGYFRPDQRSKLCESFSGIWSTCERWKTETKYRTNNGTNALYH